MGFAVPVDAVGKVGFVAKTDGIVNDGGLNWIGWPLCDDAKKSSVIGRGLSVGLGDGVTARPVIVYVLSEPLYGTAR